MVGTFMCQFNSLLVLNHKLGKIQFIFQPCPSLKEFFILIERSYELYRKWEIITRKSCGKSESWKTSKINWLSTEILSSSLTAIISGGEAGKTWWFSECYGCK